VGFARGAAREPEKVEMLERCDAAGRPLGPVRRQSCHGDPSIIHLVVHLHLFDGAGGLFLQKRSSRKDLYPGRWDTAVGGHVHAGESP
jgi:isopentenyldiphosphate isomerase